MSKRFRLRDLFLRYRWLDELRINTLAAGACHGTLFMARSFRVTRLVSRRADECLESCSPVIFAIFHGHMVASMALPGRQNITTLASASRDGEIIARAGRGMGFNVARGSPAHGAVQGTLSLIDAVKRGHSLLFFVDGPRGPRFQVKMGVIRLSQMSGIPIIPVVCGARDTWVMKTWDAYLAPHWGSPLVHIYGDPLVVPADAGKQQLEALRSELQENMDRMLQSASAFWRAAG